MIRGAEQAFKFIEYSETTFKGSDSLNKHYPLYVDTDSYIHAMSDIGYYPDASAQIYLE